MGEYDLTIGPLLIGLFLNTYLYGLVTYQFIVYKNTAFNDPLWIKYLVAALFFIDTVHSAVSVYAAWEVCVANFNNPEILALVSWTIPFTAFATALAAFMSQLFLAHRVLALTKNKILVGVIVAMSTASCFLACFAGVYSGILHYVARFKLLDPYVTSWLALQTSTDVLLTCSLSLYLARSRTGFRRTDTVVNRIIRGAVQTGLFASIFALADLFSFLLAHQTNFYTLFVFPLGRIYTNTLLDTLNARTSLKGSLAASYTDHDTNAFQFTSTNHAHAIRSIRIQEEVVTTHDGNSDQKYHVEEESV